MFWEATCSYRFCPTACPPWRSDPSAEMWRRRKSWRHRPTGPDPGATSEKKVKNIYSIWNRLSAPQLLFELKRGRGRIFVSYFVSPSHIFFLENTIKFACGTRMACSHLGGRTLFPKYSGRHTFTSHKNTFATSRNIFSLPVFCIIAPLEYRSSSCHHGMPSVFHWHLHHNIFYRRH